MKDDSWSINGCSIGDVSSLMPLLKIVMRRHDAAKSQVITMCSSDRRNKSDDRG